MSAGRHKRSRLARRTVLHDPRHCNCLWHAPVNFGRLTYYSELPHIVRTAIR